MRATNRTLRRTFREWRTSLSIARARFQTVVGLKSGGFFSHTGTPTK